MPVSDILRYEETGLSLLQTLKQAKDAVILDLGCEHNHYKQVIPSVIGVDIVNPAADIIADIVDMPFPDNYADIILLFGILYCAELERITPGVYSEPPANILHKQLTEVIRVAKPGAILYCRSVECGILNKQNVDTYTNLYNLQYKIPPKHIFNKHNSQYRLYWVWEVRK